MFHDRVTKHRLMKLLLSLARRAGLCEHANRNVRGGEVRSRRTTVIRDYRYVRDFRARFSFYKSFH